jgi:hypothetical protein
MFKKSGRAETRHPSIHGLCERGINWNSINESYLYGLFFCCLNLQFWFAHSPCNWPSYEYIYLLIYKIIYDCFVMGLGIHFLIVNVILICVSS